MGICLDTEANTSAQETNESTDWKGGGGQNSANVRTPASGTFPMQNLGKVKFDPPKVPVIFVLGGPGSGKVTHCDTLMQEKRGVTHINMMDLLQQYAIGNDINIKINTDMQDFSQLSSKTVTEVLMLEMKMAPAAKAYLVSGYPRSMRDVVEYSEKIQVVNGVVLISWRQAILQKQIDYGAKLGHVVLSLAKMELDNFFKNVMPVADYFDQSDTLVAVNGERSPTEVYKDFRTAILDILSSQDNPEAMLNGVAGMGRGIDDIPGSIVSVDTAPSQHKNVLAPTKEDQHSTVIANNNHMMGQNVSLFSNQIGNNNNNLLQNIPPIIWVIGGPGSNKATLCLKAVGFNPGWGHFSVGRLLRALAESDPKPNTENYSVKEAISEGDMVAKKTIEKLFENQILQLRDKKGIIIDGYPRDIDQIKDFETKYKQKPSIILLDCSKLQLGRGRLDDTVSSFRRRLEVFRVSTLPMLKTMDNDGRLTIIDGDPDSPSVQREFDRVIRTHIQSADGKSTNQNKRNPIDENRIQRDAIVHDLEDVPGVVPTISHHVSLANGHIGNNKPVANGNAGHGRQSLRNMLEEAENYNIDTHM